AGTVQMAALRTRDHCLRRPLVSAVLAFLSRCRGVAPGTRPPCGPHYYLALGAALCPRAEQEMSARTETDQRFLESRRNLHLRTRELAVRASCSRFHGRYD